VALHGLVIAVLWVIAQGALKKEEPVRTIEITLAPAPPPVQPLPPKPASPKPTPRPVEHTQVVQPTLPPQVTPTPPVAEAPPVVAPPAPEPPAPPAPPAPPQIIGNAGMPSNYVNTVWSSINSHVRYPASARREHVEGTVGYALILSPAGELLDVKVTKSSGNDSLDAAALEAIRASAPFGKLPDLGGTRYRLVGAVAYALN
jgi:protein TonB